MELDFTGHVYSGGAHAALPLEWVRRARIASVVVCCAGQIGAHDGHLQPDGKCAASMDWQKILKAYMEQVYQAEGRYACYVPFSGPVDKKLSNEERAALMAINEELTRTQPRFLLRSAGAGSKA
jgi:hypothetical protein